MRSTLICAIVLACTACGVTEPDPRWSVPENIQYAEVLNVQLEAMNRTETGLYWQDLEVGTGATAAVGNTIRVHYTGWLPDGTMFETSRQAGKEPLEIEHIGLGLLIRGWDEGIPGMRVGGRRKLVIPPKLAYGRAGKGSIPPLTTLIFDIELLWVKPTAGTQ